MCENVWQTDRQTDINICSETRVNISYKENQTVMKNNKRLKDFNLCLVGGGRKVVAHFYTGSSAANFDFCDLRPEWQFFLDTILHDPTKNKILIFSAKSWFLASSRR